MISNLDSADALRARLEALVSREPVMLFMKGTPDAPRCGFSATIVALLRDAGVKFGYYDILGDEAVRQGLKEFSKWPTFPQLYARGELVGGLDVAKVQAWVSAPLSLTQWPPRRNWWPPTSSRPLSIYRKSLSRVALFFSLSLVLSTGR